MRSVDVAIIGGGPAGSTAATLLAREGLEVVVFEKDQFPRFAIGESLLPFSMDALERLGVVGKMQAAGFLPKHGAQVTSGCGTKETKFYFKNAFRSCRPTAFQVPRDEFDLLLLEHAREAGAAVRYRTRVSGVEWESGGCRLEARETDGEKSQWNARFLIDCSGRNSLIGSKLGLKKEYPKLKKFAVFAHYEGVPMAEGPDGTLTQMIREPDRWFWLIPLSKSKLSLGLVMDLSEFRKGCQNPEKVLEDAIAGQPLIRERLRNATRATPVRATGDYSFRNRTFHGRNWLLAGDAAGFIDPVFSSGVFLALFSGEGAAKALLEALRSPSRAGRAFRRYERSLHRVMDLYQKFVEGWYEKEFIETVLNPQNFFQIVPAVNAVLAGNPGRDFAILWRIWIFRALVELQKKVPISPRLELKPGH